MMKNAEEQYIDELSKSMEYFGQLLKPYFRKMDNDSLETLLLISMAIFLGASNIYQVIKLFGLPKTMTYDRIKGVSIYYWRLLLQQRLYEIALLWLKERILTLIPRKPLGHQIGQNLKANKNKQI